MRNSPLRGVEYRKDPARTWERLMNAAKVHDARIRQMRCDSRVYAVATCDGVGVRNVTAPYSV